MRLWRWLCCRTGHHRETVEMVARWEKDWSTGLPGCFIVRDSLCLRCLDCPQVRPLYSGIRRTPSRRYALRGKA